MAVPARLERHKESPGGIRAAPEPEGLPDPLALCSDGQSGRKGGREHSLDWLCRQLAGGNIERADRLYYRTDLVRVMEHYGYSKAEQIIERLAANQAVARPT